MKRNVSWIVALVVGFLLGLFTAGSLGMWGSKKPGASPPPVAQGPRPRAADESRTVYRVPIDGSAVKGPADALVTIVESSDFQCPYCKRVTPTLKQVEQAYAGKVRFVFKHNPLPMHPLAPGAAQAAEAARAQGGDEKFWAMHDALFELSPDLDPARLEAAAQKLGLDVAKLKADMAAGAVKDRIDRDQQLVTALGATGTPAFFINGRKLSGAQPFEAFKAVIDEELTKAQALVRAGTPASRVYEAVIARGATAPVQPQGQRNPPPQGPPPVVYRKVPVNPDDPVLGAAAAPVTVVVFSDFQCPFCGRVEPSLKQLAQEYAGKVRFVWKHQPLPMHPNAVPAAIAAEAAREQGKFWEMHDKLFAAQQDLTPATYERYAKELKLDLAKFKASVAAARGQARISADQQLAGSVGVNGTPTMFFNCRQVVGAVPYPMLKQAMDEELKKADALLKGGKVAAGFYDKACDANLALAAAAPPAAAPALAAPQPAEAPAPAAAVPPDALSLRPDDPVRGNAKAPVTLVLFSDFECPFCSRIEPTISQVEQTYGDKVRVVWKHQPLPMHPQAIPAAEAAEAAREQGKFWEMHDKLFQNQRALSPDAYAQFARELGLDMAKFDAARQSGRGRARIQQDQAVANRIGVGGTPTLFVNGERIVGAVPFEQLKSAIDRQLARK